MALHFSKGEFTSRQEQTIRKLKARGLDGLLMFRQESMYYLTGYDTFGYVFFQCLYLGVDGGLTLLTRAPDLRQAQHTSIIEDIRIWVDGVEADPVTRLKCILDEHGCKGAALGVEWEAYGLTAANGRKLETGLSDFCTLEDTSNLVNEQRLVKSPAEIIYVKKAAELADKAFERAIEMTGPGVFEGDILAAMHSEIFEGGGDYPGNEFIIASGRDALLCRYFSGRRHLSPRDQLTLEFAGAYRHYHAALMHTLQIGEPPLARRDMHLAAIDAMEATTEALIPGNTAGEAFDAHARILDSAGLKPHRLNACGYSLGTTFAPNWMDWPMLYHGNPVAIEPGMVFFVHIIIVNSDTQQAATLGKTVLITKTGSESLSRIPPDLIVK